MRHEQIELEFLYRFSFFLLFIWWCCLKFASVISFFFFIWVYFIVFFIRWDSQNKENSTNSVEKRNTKTVTKKKNEKFPANTHLKRTKTTAIKWSMKVWKTKICDKNIEFLAIFVWVTCLCCFILTFLWHFLMDLYKFYDILHVIFGNFCHSFILLLTLLGFYFVHILRI